VYTIDDGAINASSHQRNPMDTLRFPDRRATIIDPADIDLPSTQPIDIAELIRAQTDGAIVKPT
jgi:hypothetical protein